MLESYHKRIELDLASFADPGSVEVIPSGRTLYAEWKMRGEPREATFTFSSDSGVSVKTDDITQPQPYSIFLVVHRSGRCNQPALTL